MYIKNINIKDIPINTKKKLTKENMIQIEKLKKHAKHLYRLIKNKN